MKNTFDYEEYYTNLPAISYDEIIDKLMNACYQDFNCISFITVTDPSTLKKYLYVSVRHVNGNKDTYEEYKSPSQDPDQVSNELHARIEQRIYNPIFQLYEDGMTENYFCYLGHFNNRVEFPTSTAKALVKEMRESKKD